MLGAWRVGLVVILLLAGCTSPPKAVEEPAPVDAPAQEEPSQDLPVNSTSSTTVNGGRLRLDIPWNDGLWGVEVTLGKALETRTVMPYNASSFQADTISYGIFLQSAGDSACDVSTARLFAAGEAGGTTFIDLLTNQDPLPAGRYVLHAWRSASLDGEDQAGSGTMDLVFEGDGNQTLAVRPSPWQTPRYEMQSLNASGAISTAGASLLFARATVNLPPLEPPGTWRVEQAYDAGGQSCPVDNLAGSKLSPFDPDPSPSPIDGLVNVTGGRFMVEYKPLLPGTLPVPLLSASVEWRTLSFPLR